VLAARGGQPGDRISLLTGNRLEWFDTTFGVMKADLIRTYINTRNSVAEIRYQIEDSGSTMVVVTPELEPVVRETGIDSSIQIIVLGDDYEAELAGADPSWSRSTRPVNHPAEIRYTSGTSGQAKGAVLSHTAWWACVVGMLNSNPRTAQDVMLHVTNLAHGSGCYAYQFLATGGKQIIHREFNPQKVAETVAHYRVTAMHMVPTMVYMLHEYATTHDVDMSSMRSLAYAAAPMSPDRLAQCLEWLGPVFTQSYGMSEALGGMTAFDKVDHVIGTERLASCGRPSLLGELIIADDDGHEVPRGEIGEIIMRGPSLFSEYWRKPEATAAAFTSDGWFRSGDVGRMDEEGFVYIIDRKSDMIISGGFNVYPLEVEQALMAHPAVGEVAVFGAADEKWGEAVTATVRLRDGEHATEDELRDFARTRVAAYKVPKRVLFVNDPLPRNTNGKLLRRVLRDRCTSGAEQMK
jgi:acyl-CoA synthetase (AMP-forming)/AMP-acid ligase II